MGKLMDIAIEKLNEREREQKIENVIYYLKKIDYFKKSIKTFNDAIEVLEKKIDKELEEKEKI